MEDRNESTSGSGSASDAIRAAVMEAITDLTVLAALAERVADAVFAKFEKRMSAFESELHDKDKRRNTGEKCVVHGGANRCSRTIFETDIRTDKRR